MANNNKAFSLKNVLMAGDEVRTRASLFTPFRLSRISSSTELID